MAVEKKKAKNFNKFWFRNYKVNNIKNVSSL